MGYKIDYGKYLELQKNMEELMTQMLEDMAVLENIERYLWGCRAIQSNAIDAINAYISDKHLETAIPAIKSAFTNFYVVENAYFLEMYNIEEKSDSVIEEEHLKNVEDELTRLKTEVSTFIQNMNAELNAVSHIVNLETKSETDFQDSVDNLISISRKLREDFATYEKNKLLEARGIEWVIDASIMAIDECNGSSYTMKNYTPEADIELETPEYITRASTFYNAHQYTEERLDNVLDKKTSQAAKDEDIDTTMLNNVVENGYVNKIRQELANVDETEISSDVDSDMDFHNDSDIIEPSMAEDIDDVDASSFVANTLTEAQKSRLTALENTINDHLTDADFSGTLRDLQGNPVPNGRGGYFDHLGEMQDSYKSLQKIKKALEGSLKNPNLSDVDRVLLQEGLDKAIYYINKIEELFGPYGGIN